MKKKILFIAVLICIIATLLCGCTISPKASADNFMKGIQTQDMVKLVSVYDIDSIDMENTVNGFIKDCMKGNISLDSEAFEKYEPYLDKLLDFDYEILNEKIDGDQATVNVKITAYNYGEAFKRATSNLLNQSLSLFFSFDLSNIQNSMESTVIDAFSKAEKNSELIATLELEKKNGGWLVQDVSKNTSFINAITGGLYDAIISFSDDWFK